MNIIEALPIFEKEKSISNLSQIKPEANLFIGKVLDEHGRGSVGNLINAIYYSINWRGKMVRK